MEKKTTYSIYYTPSESQFCDNINYVCSDGKIHIRFRDFNTSQVVAGFERKLTYLTTYLMNYSYLPTLIGKYDDAKLIDGFLKTTDLANVYTCIKENIHNEDFKGFKFSLNYKKSNVINFGDVNPNYFPLLSNESGVLSTGSLTTFTDMFKVNLTDFLFDDSYIVILENKNTRLLNKKFIDKETRKLDKINNNDSDLEQLW